MTLTATHSLDFGGEAICFSIERTSRRKTVAISVGYDGVRVLAPHDLDDDRVVAIVRQKGAWLLRKQRQVCGAWRRCYAARIRQRRDFPLFGRPYRLKVVQDASAVLESYGARGFICRAGSAGRDAANSACRSAGRFAALVSRPCENPLSGSRGHNG